jgi:hypothetical protein
MTTVLEFTLKGRRLELSVERTFRGVSRTVTGAEVDLDDGDAAELLLAHIGEVEIAACICNFRAPHWVKPVGALVPSVVAAAREAVGRG